VTDTALLAALVATIAGVVAGRLWAASTRRGELRDKAGFRVSPHFIQGLHAVATRQIDLAISELTKVVRIDPGAVEAQLILGNLLAEAGQLEQAIRTHQAVVERRDLSRSERAYAQSCLGSDFRRAGFLDRATQAFREVLDLDPKSVHALTGLQKLHEDQRLWREAYEIQTRLARLRKTDDSLVLGFLQAEVGHEAVRLGDTAAAEECYRVALSLDRRVLPAAFGLADLAERTDPARAAALLEDAIKANPDRAYLAFDRLARLYSACGEPSRFVALCERTIRQNPRDWRARLALARHLRDANQLEDAFGLLLRAVEANPHVLMAHLEMWRTLRDLGVGCEAVESFEATARSAIFYRDPHLCTACRYRADDMLWRCPHCHEWNTFVEERVGPSVGPSASERILLQSR
jgi:lipopolysaccharide biosynthesis regulator YciM